MAETDPSGAGLQTSQSQSAKTTKAGPSGAEPPTPRAGSEKIATSIPLIILKYYAALAGIEPIIQENLADRPGHIRLTGRPDEKTEGVQIHQLATTMAVPKSEVQSWMHHAKTRVCIIKGGKVVAVETYNIPKTVLADPQFPVLMPKAWV